MVEGRHFVSVAPAWLDELDLQPGPPWLRMGLRTITEDAWLDVDEGRDAELSTKRRLVAERPNEVFAALPGTEPAGAEVLELVVTELGRRGVAVEPEGDRHPLEAAALLVQEDLCLMVDRDGASHLDAASLCFPSHWRLADKIGRPAAEVHGPVPHYRTELETKVDRFLERVSPGRIAMRRNWSVSDHCELFAPSHPPAVDVSADDAGERLWIRSERQTLRRLPRSGAVLFTIRVQHAPLGALAARPERAAALAEAAEASAAAGHPRVHGPHLGTLVAWVGQVTANRSA